MEPWLAGEVSGAPNAVGALGAPSTFGLITRVSGPTRLVVAIIIKTEPGLDLDSFFSHLDTPTDQT